MKLSKRWSFKMEKNHNLIAKAFQYFENIEKEVSDIDFKFVENVQRYKHKEQI